MALKGHSIIELTDVNTGEVEIHEDDNIVTNALSKLLNPASYGTFCNDPLYDLLNFNRTEKIKCLTGGIMLFDGNIEENPEIINSPVGVSVVGCGSQIGYNGINTMAGSYNQTESGWTDDGSYKHVWDFTTPQANGNIACVCLTTNSGGKITEGTYPYASDYQHNYGTSEEIKYEKSFNTNNYYIKINGWGNGSLAYWILFADYKKNRIIFPKTKDEVYFNGTYSSNNDGYKKSILYKKSIDLALTRIAFTNFSVLNDTINSDDKVTDYITVQMPSELANIINQKVADYPNYHFGISSVNDEENIYIIIRYSSSNSGGIAVGDNIYIWQINAQNFESSYFTFTNNLDIEICYDKFGSFNWVQDTYNGLGNSFQITKDYIVCRGKNNKSYVISRDTNEVSEVKTKDGNTKSAYYLYNKNGKIYCSSGNGVASVLMVIDPKTQLLSYKNTSLENINMSYNSSAGSIINLVGSHYMIGKVGYSDGGVGLYQIIDPTLLVTINNLSTPVQKTSAQTMKITYVLSET